MSYYEQKDPVGYIPLRARTPQAPPTIENIASAVPRSSGGKRKTYKMLLICSGVVVVTVIAMVVVTILVAKKHLYAKKISTEGTALQHIPQQSSQKVVKSPYTDHYVGEDDYYQSADQYDDDHCINNRVGGQDNDDEYIENNGELGGQHGSEYYSEDEEFGQFAELKPLNVSEMARM